MVTEFSPTFPNVVALNSSGSDVESEVHAVTSDSCALCCGGLSLAPVAES